MSTINANTVRVTRVRTLSNGAHLAEYSFKPFGATPYEGHTFAWTFIPRALAPDHMRRSLNKWVADSIGAVMPFDFYGWGHFRAQVQAGAILPHGWQNNAQAVLYVLNHRERTGEIKAMYDHDNGSFCHNLKDAAWVTLYTQGYQMGMYGLVTSSMPIITMQVDGAAVAQTADPRATLIAMAKAQAGLLA